MTVPMIASYADAEAVFAKARNPEKGKPLKNTYRLIKDGDEFIVRSSNKNVAKIYRNNTVEVFVPKNTPSYLLMTVLPQLVPVKVGWIGRKMAFMHTDKKVLIPHYNGLTFDMIAGNCVSQPPTKPDIIKEKRREYLRDLRVFKRQFETRLKLGVIDSIAAQIMAGESGLWTMRIRWDHDTTKQAVVRELQSKTVSHEFATVLVGDALARNSYYRPSPPHGVYRRTLEIALKNARGLIYEVYGIHKEPTNAEI
jgi:hypothetical protein